MPPPMREAREPQREPRAFEPAPIPAAASAETLSPAAPARRREAREPREPREPRVRAEAREPSTEEHAPDFLKRPVPVRRPRAQPDAARAATPPPAGEDSSDT